MIKTLLSDFLKIMDGLKMFGCKNWRSALLCFPGCSNWQCSKLKVCCHWILGWFDLLNPGNNPFVCINMILNRMCSFIDFWCFLRDFPSLEHIEWLLKENYLDVSLVDLHYPIIAVIFRGVCRTPLLSSAAKIHE